MPEAEPVTHDAIVRALAATLEPLPFVDAMWEGGAAAFGRVDEWSDVDLYIVAADDGIEDTFRAIEETLGRLSPIRQKYEPAWPPESGIAQAFYRLERASEYLLVDLAVMKRSAPDKYLEPELHGQAIFAFNKGDAVKVPSLDMEEFVRKLLDRRDRLAARIGLFVPLVTKELLRRNTLGALEAYQRILLDALIQALRMRHAPAHYAFGVRYVPYELPPEIVRRIERLSFVGSTEDLPEMSREVAAWFRETVADVTEERIRSLLRDGANRATAEP